MEFIMFLFMSMFMLSFHSSTYNNLLNFSKMEEVECGLDSMSESNLNSNQFFLFMIIFLLFDLELVAMIPMMMSNTMMIYVLVSMLVVISMIYELVDYSLKFN